MFRFSLPLSITTDKAAAECRLTRRFVDPFHRALVSPPLSHTPMQRWVGYLLGLVCIKPDMQAHVVNTRSRRKEEELCTPSKPNTLQQTPVRIWNGYLRLGEFSISSAFRTVNSSAQTCWPLQWWSVLTSLNRVHFWMFLSLMGFKLLKAGRNVEEESLMGLVLSLCLKWRKCSSGRKGKLALQFKSTLL